MASGGELSPIFLLLGPVLFLGMWLGMSLLFSKLSGWARLAERFPARPGAPRPPTRIVTARMKGVQYKNALRVGSDESGLFVGTVLLFRTGHPWLHIPWSQVTEEPPSPGILRYQSLHLDPDGDDVPLRIRGSVVQELLAARR